MEKVNLLQQSLASWDIYVRFQGGVVVLFFFCVAYFDKRCDTSL